MGRMLGSSTHVKDTSVAGPTDSIKEVVTESLMIIINVCALDDRSGIQTKSKELGTCPLAEECVAGTRAS